MSDDWRSYRQGRNGWSPTSGTNLTEWRRGRSHKLLGEAFDFNKHGASANAGAGAVLLILIFGAIALIGNLLGTHNKYARNPSATQPGTSANANICPPQRYCPPTNSTLPASGAYTPNVKPPAGHPLGAPQALPYSVRPDSVSAASGAPGPAGLAEQGSESGSTSGPNPASPSSPAGPYHFAAIHREFGGGCAGELVLSNEGLHFSCPGQPDINVPLAEIDRLDKDGIRLVSGKKYHFKISDDDKAQIETIFGDWLDKARQNRAAYGHGGSNIPAN